MVTRDLSVPDSYVQTFRDEVRIASASDRFMAAFLDFLIMSPIVSFCVAGFLKEIKTYLLLDPQSTEASVIWILFATCSVGLVLLVQAFFLYFMQATPGQKFMQMKVISYPRRFEALTFSQCLLRSTLWCLSFGLLAAPFLEVIGHPLRRSFHERASDTLVITLKDEHDEGPLPLERKFVGSWLRLFFLFVFMLSGLYGIKVYRMVQEGHFASLAGGPDALLCNQIPAELYVGSRRIDIAIAMFLSDEVSADCVRKEAEYSLWNSLESEKSWAYLAKGLIVEEKLDQEHYFTKACEWDPKNNACHLANYFASDEDQDFKALMKNELSVTAKVLIMNDLLDAKKYENAILFIKDLQKEALLKTAMERYYVRSIWALNEAHKSFSKARQPASSERSDLVQEFKEKYGVK